MQHAQPLKCDRPSAANRSRTARAGCPSLERGPSPDHVRSPAGARPGSQRSATARTPAALAESRVAPAGTTRGHVLDPISETRPSSARLPMRGSIGHTLLRARGRTTAPANRDWRPAARRSARHHPRPSRSAAAQPPAHQPELVERHARPSSRTPAPTRGRHPHMPAAVERGGLEWKPLPAIIPPTHGEITHARRQPRPKPPPRRRLPLSRITVLDPDAPRAPGRPRCAISPTGAQRHARSEPPPTDAEERRPAIARLRLPEPCTATSAPIRLT